eukprot:SAG31_NODE_1752_length_7351_cov_29.035852_2_plen_270_part_00
MRALTTVPLNWLSRKWVEVTPDYRTQSALISLQWSANGHSSLLTASKLDSCRKLARELAVSSLNNAAVGGFLFNPTNLARARLQLQPDIRPNYYSGLLDCLQKVAAEDGITALWRYGMVLSVLRETSYGGLQWGLYTPLKNALGVGRAEDSAAANFARKLGAGLAAGALASVLITPIDLVMIKQFVESGRIDPRTGCYTTGLAAGRLPTYPGGTLAAYQSIIAADGFAGLFRGWQPTMWRAALITAGLTVGYDQVSMRRFNRLASSLKC